MKFLITVVDFRIFLSERVEWGCSLIEEVILKLLVMTIWIRIHQHQKVLVSVKSQVKMTTHLSSSNDSDADTEDSDSLYLGEVTSEEYPVVP